MPSESDRILTRLGEAGVIPVVALPTADAAEALGQALLDGGLACVEVTFRTAAATDAIRILRAACPGLLVGAGTVLTIDQARAAEDAGAEFLVAPGLNSGVVEHAQERDLPMIPGVSTPTEIEHAMALDLDVVKFFPAEVAGGTGFLRAVAAVYPGVRFVPTGGIGPDNLASYLALPCVLAVGGSWIAPQSLLAKGDYSTVRRLAREAVEAVAASRPGEARAEMWRH